MDNIPTIPDEITVVKVRQFERQLELIVEFFEYYAKVSQSKERQYAFGLASEKIKEALELVYSNDENN